MHKVKGGNHAPSRQKQAPLGGLSLSLLCMCVMYVYSRGVLPRDVFVGVLRELEAQAKATPLTHTELVGPQICPLHCQHTRQSHFSDQLLRPLTNVCEVKQT